MLGWYGKEVLPDGRVHSLLFRRPSGRIVALNPAWMPVAIVLRWLAFAHSPAARVAFQAFGPMLMARGTSAQIEVREFHGQRSAAIVYDR
jgi:hypothetical protein